MRNFHDVDIVDCLRTIFVGTVKEHEIDFKFDMMRIFSEAQRAMELGGPRYLLWMAGPDGTWCFPEGNVYIRNSPENRIWCGYRNEPGTISAFALEITGIRNNSAAGNLYEYTYAEHAETASKNLFEAHSAEIVLHHGETLNISLDEFNYYKLQLELEHNSIRNISYVLDEDLSGYTDFLAKLRADRELYFENAVSNE